MQVYEVRVFDENGKTQLIAAEVGLNDNAAIRSGRAIAAGKHFEVWRGMDCIYGLESPPQTVRGKQTIPIDLSPP